MFYKLPDFEYYRASTVEEAIELASRLGDYKFLAGGTDLLVDLKIGRYKPKAVIDIGGLRELGFIVDEGDRIRIGALTRLEEILRSKVVEEKIPVLRQAVYNMASWQIRNIATIGGNIANASPAADTAPPLLVHGALVKVKGPSGERKIPIEEFFLGPRRTVLGRGEVITEFEIPVVEGFRRYYAFKKLGRRNAFTLSIVAVAVGIEEAENGVRARVALNSVAPKPVRAYSVEKYLEGKTLSRDLIAEASKLVWQDISPITDVRATAEYRRHMAYILLRDSLLEILEEMKR
ncbi:FAD binding domain-containing protein [Thermogladius sp. 4427co]|uniref:FAD binding domain-containing protein n=1 Tax=Thermogladius sp. 4427co TaxID=3450718 RepID=UPI003F798FBA